MIDELYKHQIDKFWNLTGRLAARAGLSANAVTVIGTVACAVNALLFVWHRNPLVFGIALGLIELLDNVDGAVARVTGSSSSFGAYLDATTDRYKEIFIFLAIAQVTGYWLPSFLAVSGSLMVSYSLARAEVEGATLKQSRSGPALFERFERLATLSAGLIFTSFLPTDLLLEYDLLFWVLWFLALMSYVTAGQRFLAARRQLRL